MLNPELKFIPRTEFDGPPYFRGLAEGKATGKAEGKAEGSIEATVKALLRVLAARQLGLTEEQRQRVLACRDQEQLERWLDASVTASSSAALLGVK